MEAFWAGGYTATSTQDLCDATGLARSSLYNAFTGKRDLFEQALRRYAANTRRDMAMLVAARAPAPVVIRDFLMSAIDTQWARADRRGCLAVNAAVEVGPDDARLASLSLLDFDELTGAFRQVVERGQRDGDIPAGRDAAALARLIHSCLVGLHVVGRVADDRARLTDIVDALIDSF